MWKLLCLSICIILFTCFGYGQDTNAIPCGSNQIPCDNFHCIGREKWCDGKKDCTDESDENFCETSKEPGFFSWSNKVIPPKHKCSDIKHYTCDNAQCYPLSVECDGVKDCKDGSDEKYCSPTETTTNSHSSEVKDGYSKLIFDEFKDSKTKPLILDLFDVDILETTLTTQQATTSTHKPATVSEKPSTYSSAETRIVEATTPMPMFSVHVPSTPKSPRSTFASENKKTSTEQHLNHITDIKRPVSQSYRHTQTDKTNLTRRNPKKLTTPMDYYPRNDDVLQNRKQNRYGHTIRNPNPPNAHYSHLRHTYDTRVTQYSHHSPSSTRHEISNPNFEYGIHVNTDVVNASPLNSNSINSKPAPLRNAGAEPYSYYQRNPYPNEQQHTSGKQIVRLLRKKLHPDQSAAPNAGAQRQGSTYGHTPVRPFNRSISTLRPLHFNKSYTEEFAPQYLDNIQKAETWVYANRDSVTFTWNKDTPRALIALSLISNSFMANDDNNKMKKAFETELGIKLLEIRNRPSSMSNSKLAIYINALLATCQNPKDFYGQDLTETLAYRWRSKTLNENHLNPFIFLTLCLTNTTVNRNEMHAFLSNLHNGMRWHDEASKDIYILSTTALACFQQHDQYQSIVTPRLERAIQELLYRIRDDGSFGSLHSTALAAQALMSSSIPLSWDAKKTLDYLADKQMADGSFGSMLGTYLVLPVLNGRSLLHLRNTQCDQNSTVENANSFGVKKSIHFTLKVGNPETSSISMILNVPETYNVFEIMKFAEKTNPQYRFRYSEDFSGRIDVHSILGIPNDPQLGDHWYLYIIKGQNSEYVEIDLNLSSYKYDIREYKPSHDEELIYWYLNLE